MPLIFIFTSPSKDATPGIVSRPIDPVEVPSSSMDGVLQHIDVAKAGGKAGSKACSVDKSFPLATASSDSTSSADSVSARTRSRAKLIQKACQPRLKK